VAKELYNSIISKIASVVPMFAKALVDIELEKINATPYTVTPIQLRKILNEGILPKLKKFVKTPTELETMGVGMIVMDKNDKVVFSNAVAKKLIGTDEKVVFNNRKKFKNEQLEAVNSILKFLKKEKRVLAKRIKIEKPKIVLDIIGGSLIDKTDKVSGAIFFLQDITLRVALELETDRLYEELEKAKTSLEEKVRERTKELEKERKELTERMDELKRFQDLIIGREKKMIEFKKEIAELKNKLGEK